MMHHSSTWSISHCPLWNWSNTTGFPSFKMLTLRRNKLLGNNSKPAGLVLKINHWPWKCLHLITCHIKDFQRHGQVGSCLTNTKWFMMKFHVNCNWIRWYPSWKPLIHVSCILQQLSNDNSFSFKNISSKLNDN